MGGRIALQYALKYQHLMTGLVLIGATPGIEDESERTRRTKQDEERASTLLNEPIEAFLDSWFKQKLISSQQRITEPYRSKMQQARYSQNKDALAYYLTALGTGSMNPAWNQLNELHIPTLLITGEEDTKFTSIAQKMVRSLPNANFETVTGAGHAACFENPIEFAHRLERFIENCPS
jgi:2-succinyl-6-hydroxy-2,4-cyclohexadiene-1-carboxylate synthase